MRRPRTLRRDHAIYANPANRFHITTNAHPEVPAWGAGIADSILKTLHEYRVMGSVQLFAASLMPDHLHLLAAPGGEVDLIGFMDRFKSLTARRSWDLGHHGGLWQPGWYDRQVGPQEFDGVVGYIVANPVVAGVVEAWDEYPYSWVVERT